MIDKQLAAILFVVVLFNHAMAQHSEDPSVADSSSATFSALPTAYYTPETRIALEAFAYLSFQTDTAARKSNARMFLPQSPKTAKSRSTFHGKFSPQASGFASTANWMFGNSQSTTTAWGMKPKNLGEGCTSTEASACETAR